MSGRTARRLICKGGKKYTWGKKKRRKKKKKNMIEKNVVTGALASVPLPPRSLKACDGCGFL